MRLLSCYFTSRRPSDDTWPRLARALERSVRLHSPGWEVRIEEHGAKNIAGDRLTSQDMANTQKLRWWAAQVLNAADGARLLLCDTDVFVTGSLTPVWDHPFDVAYTVRANHRIPFNAGVVFVRVNDASRWFIGNWAAENERLAGSHERRRQLRPRFVGINQSALGLVLDQPSPAKVAALPCLEWNCEDSSWDLFDPGVTKIVHVKGALRRDVLAGRASRPGLERLVRLWAEAEG